MMKLLRADARNIWRDPLMLLVLCVPVMMWGAAAFLLPWADQQLAAYISGFQLAFHTPFIVSVVLLMTPLMVGLASGFLLLDEKDEGILGYMDITPVRKTGYLLYRLTLPVGASLLLSILLATGLLADFHVQWGYLLLSILMITLMAAVLAMFLASFSDNKVEGMAYAKVSSLLMLGPFLVYLFQDHSWTMLLYIIPLTWGTQSIMAAIDGGSGVEHTGRMAAVLGGGYGVHLLWLLFFYQKLKRSL